MSKRLKNLKPGRYVLYTMREGYSLDDGSTVPTRDMQRLFADSELPIQPKGSAALHANDDGLFPGFSQTWAVKE